jgi:DNA-binding response OmpR family regulator
MTVGRSNGRLVLVIDDDPRLLRLVYLILQTAGHDVEVAHGGREGLDLILERQPAIVVLDLNMPDVGGETVYQLARESGHDGEYIVLSADIAARLKSARMGVAFIQKPFDPSQLLDLIAEIGVCPASESL